MTEAAWIVRGMVGLIFFISGWIKLEESRSGLKSKLGKWTDDFSLTKIRVIGVLELLGAIGIVIPGVMGLSPFYAISSSVCLALLLVSAVVMHIKRKEYIPSGVCTLILALNILTLYELINNHDVTLLL